MLLHRHVILDDFHRGNECFPAVATAAAVCLNYLTAQSLFAHNNQKLVRAGLSHYQSPDLPVCLDYNAYGSFPSLSRALLSDDEVKATQLIIGSRVQRLLRALVPKAEAILLLLILPKIMSTLARI